MDATMDSWLDRLVAAPALGYMLDPWVISQADILAGVRGVLTTWQKDGRAFTIGDAGPVGLQIETADGFTFRVEPDKLTAQFSYAGELRPRAGQLPEFVPPQAVQPYSRLLEALETEFSDLFAALLGSRPRELVRIGLVAETEVDATHPPPGIKALLDHLAGWWESDLSATNLNTLVTLGRREGSLDRCHHRMSLEGPSSSTMALKLDWQRVFDPPQRIHTAKAARGLTADARHAAMQYFELFAEGNVKHVSSE